jgi:hypothetical protein
VEIHGSDVFVFLISNLFSYVVGSSTQLQIFLRDTRKISGVILNLVFKQSYDIYEKSLINE